MYTSTGAARIWHHTLSVASSFWGVCLVLVAVEAAFGSNAVSSGLFFLSIPLLVALLTWVNLGMVFGGGPRRIWSLFALGGTVLASSSLIILVGLVAAAKLKVLLSA